MLPVIIAKIKYGNEDITLKLPCKDGLLETQRNRLTEDEDATFYLSAIEPKGLAPLTGLEVNLDELNFLAKSIERFTEDEEAQFFGAVQLKKGCTMQGCGGDMCFAGLLLSAYGGWRWILVDPMVYRVQGGTRQLQPTG